MSGMFIAMAAGGATVVATWAGDLNDVVTGGTATATITVGTSGTLSGTHYTGQSEWFSPSGGTPGNSYYVKFTKTGNAWNAGLTEGTVYALTSNRSLTWSATGTAKSATLTVSIYRDSGGTDLAGTGTVTVLVDGSP